ncbi:MAG: peptidase [SAR324 cluster bacterium]|uniref:Peptidase n=1 Tax=SAR324 cluster bacterium TaxID=2024889 RepID=A0A2A4SS63_9DELT|nr:MAG: peptidase [SAR324 cluster bacterium]
MHYLLFSLFLLLCIFGPQLWVRRVFKEYTNEIPELSGTGGELAAHLIERFHLKGVSLEKTELGDHFDPQSATVRINQKNFDGKSLTAIAVAAHEVGHAIQYFKSDPMFRWRTQLSLFARKTEKAGAFAMLAIPLITVIFRLPQMGLLFFALGASSMLMAVIIHLITLPVEWDASFGKALPILRQGGYIDDSQVRIVQRILLAAALTYVSSALAGLLNVGRWLTLIRR